MFSVISVMAMLAFEEEGCGKEVGNGRVGEFSVKGGIDDEGAGGAELVDGLAAGPAGLAGSGVEIRDGDGANANGGAMKTDCGGDGGLFGADGETIGCVFDVAAGDDGLEWVVEHECGAYAKAAVGRVSTTGGGEGTLVEVGDLG
jgi:hypothetical protein